MYSMLINTYIRDLKERLGVFLFVFSQALTSHAQWLWRTYEHELQQPNICQLFCALMHDSLVQNSLSEKEKNPVVASNYYK